MCCMGIASTEKTDPTFWREIYFELRFEFLFLNGAGTAAAVTQTFGSLRLGMFIQKQPSQILFSANQWEKRENFKLEQCGIKNRMAEMGIK